MLKGGKKLERRAFSLSLFRTKSTIPTHLGEAVLRELETAPLAESLSTPESCPQERGLPGVGEDKKYQQGGATQDRAGNKGP